MSSTVAPEPGTMDRMDAPEIVANLPFGGVMYIREDVGMVANPMSMATMKKAFQACCCPSCLELSVSYTDARYSKGIQIDSETSGCCVTPKFIISTKDYSSSKMNPEKHELGKTVKAGCCAGYSIAPLGGGGSKYMIPKPEPRSCQCCACPMHMMCKNGIMKGNFCVNFKMPVFDGSTKVAYVVQTVPLIPVSCCTATTGPTLQMAIHKHPDYRGELSESDITRLSLFMFTVMPNLPDASGRMSGGPVALWDKMANKMLSTIGWALAYENKHVERDYLTFNDAFNGDIGNMGDFVDRLRGVKTQKELNAEITELKKQLESK